MVWHELAHNQIIMLLDDRAQTEGHGHEGLNDVEGLPKQLVNVAFWSWGSWLVSITSLSSEPSNEVFDWGAG